MAEQIADRYRLSQQMAVNEDGSINTSIQYGTTSVSSTARLPVATIADNESNTGSEIRVSNSAQEQLLEDILCELKKINLHLALMNDNVIKNTEVD